MQHAWLHCTHCAMEAIRADGRHTSFRLAVETQLGLYAPGQGRMRLLQWACTVSVVWSCGWAEALQLL